MKFLTYALAACFLAPTFASAEESNNELKKAGHTVKQTAKKAKNRVKEAFCTDSDLECKAKKAGNRVDETVSKAGDKIDEKVN